MAAWIARRRSTAAPMLVAGDLDPRQVRRFERGRVGAARRLDLALDRRDLRLSHGEGKMSLVSLCVEINVCRVAFFLHRRFSWR